MFYFFDNTKIYNFIILVFNIFKIKYFSLDELNLSKYKLTKPNSRQLKRDNPESIILAKNYFLNMKNINLEKKPYIIHYFLKNLEFGDFNLKNQYNFNDFLSFLRVNNINFNSSKVQIISVYKNIITNKYTNFYFSFIKNLIVFFIINIYILKVISILSLSLFFKRYEMPKILYLRKKKLS